MRKLLAKLKGDNSGASAAEYALIIAVFGVAVVAGMTTLGTAFEGTMSTSASTLNP